MTVTASKTVKEKKLSSVGLVDSPSVNPITDFLSSELNDSDLSTTINDRDFANIFICNLIFYAVFCVSLFLHILIDLGFAAFIKKQFIQLIEIRKKTDFVGRPVLV